MSSHINISLPVEIRLLLLANKPDDIRLSKYISALVIKGLGISAKDLKTMRKQDPNSYLAEIEKLARLIK